MSPLDLEQLQTNEYILRQEANRLRREVFEQLDPSARPDLLDQLADAEQRLAEAEAQRAQAQKADPASGLLLERGAAGGGWVLGAQSTGLTAQVHLRMAQVPTAVYHLFNGETHPLVSCQVGNAAQDGPIRRMRVTAFIEGYSAQAVNTVELPPGGEHFFNLLPTLFPDKVRDLYELTRATLNVLVEDLDNQKVEIHQTHPIWLLPRTTAPLAVRDPKTGEWQDLTPYLAAFVTPNAPALMTFLRVAADQHPEHRLVGFQGEQTGVEPQIKAIYTALQKAAGLAYVNSVIEFSPEDGAAHQRVRLPRESLEQRQANCIDGTVLYASLLEGISLSPALVIVPGHAFLAWETWKDSGEWHYLETTLTGSQEFEQAVASATRTAQFYKKLADSTRNPGRFRLWPLRTLRTGQGITPME